MTGQDGVIAGLEAAGYITTTAACEIVGKSVGGNIAAFMDKHKVRSIIIPSNGKREKRMYFREDVERLPKDNPPAKADGNSMNGGKLLGMICELRGRIEELERFRESLEN